MRILLIGGTGFIGSYVARDLSEQGHDVAVFHRGSSRKPLPPAIQRIHGDRRNLAQHRPDFAQFRPAVVVDFILSSGSQATAEMDLFRGIAGRVVAVSSADVYRAHGVLMGLDSGPLEPLPITEDSQLRTRLHPYPPEAIARLRHVFEWLDDEYDKIPMERAILGDPNLPGTVLRLPMVHGPGDPLHRLFPILKRMDDHRPAILIQEDAAAWRGPRGYVENMAAAIALAATSPKAAGRVYNVGDNIAFSELEWTQTVGRAAGWHGSVIAIPKDRTPAHLRVPYRNEQHWIISTEGIRNELGFTEPVPLEIALERSIAWERANPPGQIDSRQFDYAAEDAAVNA